MSKPRRPAAFRLDDPGVTIAEEAPKVADAAKVVITPASEDPFDAGRELAPPPAPRRRGWPWGRILIVSLATLASLAIGIAVDDFVRSLFARSDWLGWGALGVAGLAGLAFLAIIFREIAGLARLSRIASLRETAQDAADNDDRDKARRVVRALIDLYRSRPETARGRAEAQANIREIIDGRDLIRLAERQLMARFDAEARAMVTSAARSVSVVTAVSPRAIVDLAYVLWQSIRLIRRIAGLYGGRPSGLALIRMTRLTLAHLAVTGGVAMTDSLVQQVVGHGLAARLSARLGEGVVNGLMTARIGVAAIEVCRPLPHVGTEPVSIGEIMREIVPVSGKKKE